MSQVLLLFPLISLVPATCPPESQLDNVFGKCLQYVSQPASFAAAEKYCVAHDGHIVSVQNSFQNMQLLNSVQSNAGFRYSNYWIGLTEQSPSQWSWTDGTPFSYSNWEVRQPENFLQCTMALNGAGGTWVANDCSKALPYVCAFFDDSTNNISP